MNGASSLVAAFNSDAFAAGPGVQTQGVYFSHAFDFDTGTYYVQLSVRRITNGAGNDPAAHIVRLTQTLF